jgi:hypothetical protein
MVGAKVLDIFSMACRYSKPVKYGRESAHKNRAEEGNASLDDCMHGEQHHHQGEVGDLQRGLNEVSSCGSCQA